MSSLPLWASLSSFIKKGFGPNLHTEAWTMVEISAGPDLHLQTAWARGKIPAPQDFAVFRGYIGQASAGSLFWTSALQKGRTVCA